MKKKISIIISHRHYYDGFWILPIINKLKFKYKLEIIFCNIKINNKFSDLIDKGIKIHFVNNSLFENYLNKIFGINLKFYRVKKIITGSDTVFLSYVRNSKKLDFFRNEIFKKTKKKKIKLCFYPPISSDLIFTLPKKIKNNKIYVVTRTKKISREKKI